VRQRDAQLQQLLLEAGAERAGIERERDTATTAATVAEERVSQMQEALRSADEALLTQQLECNRVRTELEAARTAAATAATASAQQLSVATAVAAVAAADTAEQECSTKRSVAAETELTEQTAQPSAVTEAGAATAHSEVALSTELELLYSSAPAPLTTPMRNSSQRQQSGTHAWIGTYNDRSSSSSSSKAKVPGRRNSRSTPRGTARATLPTVASAATAAESSDVPSRTSSGELFYFGSGGSGMSGSDVRRISSCSTVVDDYADNESTLGPRLASITASLTAAAQQSAHTARSCSSDSASAAGDVPTAHESSSSGSSEHSNNTRAKVGATEAE
jgi:hypothetical protein